LPLEKKKEKMQEISIKIFFCYNMKVFHHDVLPRFVLNKFKVFLFTFQHFIKCFAIDFETYIFSNNTYLESVCLMLANLLISHFLITSLSVFLLCKCSSRLAWLLTLAFQ
jgi:hypothetical protein